MEALEDKIKKFLSIGSGSGSGYGSGDGDGDGYGSGSGYGSGDGYGDGYDYDLKSYNHQKVYYIDEVPTLIDSVHGMFAKGYIINRDKTTSSCYIARHGNFFAHGDTLREAQKDALSKHMPNMPEEERIEMFIKEHPSLDDIFPCEDLFRWHNTLTGSCELGRRRFCEDHGIDLNGEYTIRYFLDITMYAYGGEVIRKVKEAYETTGE